MIAKLKLDGQGPLYRQVARALTHRLQFEETGDRLPATRELAEQSGLSRNTIRAAYDLLLADGSLEVRQGSGSFVRRSVPPASRQTRSPTTPGRSDFAKRLRDIDSRGIALGRFQHGLRFNLQYGEPLANTLFTDLWRRELGRAAVTTAPGYPNAQGLRELRMAICQYLRRRRNVFVEPDDVMVVTGTQQALSLAVQVLVNPGDAVVLENPSYFLVRELMHAYGARTIGVDVDASGMVTSRLPSQPVSMVYVTPSHQFPLGATLTTLRRQQLLAYARQRDTWLFEDDYDASFRYDGQHVAPLRAEDADDRVIHVGSFSKVLAPSLRLAYVVMPRALRRDFLLAKRFADLGCPTIEQAALAHLLTSGGFDRHLRRCTLALAERRTAMLAGLAKHAGNRLKVVNADAGMHLVAWMPHASEAQELSLIQIARDVGLGLHPVSVHYMQAPRLRGLLLGFAGVSPSQIQAACALLGRCLKKI